MTKEELQAKLESSQKFVLQPPYEAIEYQFKDGYLLKDGKPFTEYSITEGRFPNHFQMHLNDVIKDGVRVFIYDYEDIILNIDGDDDFPVFINYSTNRGGRRLFVVLQAII